MQEENTVNQNSDAALETAPGVQFKIQDLVLCAQVIQLSASRGAFKAEELTQVGGMFDRLVAFLSASGALQTTASSSPSSDDTTSSDAAE
jgi:hypothetical protein